MTELELAPVEMSETQPTKRANIVKQEAKRKGLDAIKSKWEQKPLHGQYALRSKDPDIDQANTHQWLRCAGLKAETEGFIMAAQDQSLYTRNYQANIIKNGTDPKCRLCDDKIETIDHLVAGCPILAPKEYKERHNKWDSIYIGEYASTIMLNMLNTGMNITQNQLQKGMMQLSFGTSQFTLTDQLKQIGQILL